VLVNEDLDKALANIVHIIEAERQRRERQVELPAYIQTLISS
jgi:guanylate kinase